MILIVLGLTAVIVSTYLVNKTARSYGRNAFVWTVLTFVLGIGIQWVLPFILAVLLGIVFIMQGTRNQFELQQGITDWAFTISIISLALSGVAMWLTLKMVSRLPDEPVADSPPPPPTYF